MIWLLEKSVLDAISVNYTMTEAEQAQFTSAFAGGPAPSVERVMATADGVAQINITGVLTTRPDFMAMFFGGGNTLFGDIHAAIDSAENDKSIKRVEFHYGTPGGEAHATIPLGDKIASMTKPHTAVVDSALSAGYWLASQSNTIHATSRVSRVGSIGVVGGYIKPSASRYAEITSTNAPNKRPDPETDEGKAAIRVELDELHDLFALAVATGRNTTEAKVNKDFGQGGVLLAAKAKDVGMIDTIADGAKLSTPKSGKTAQTNQIGATKMDLDKLKAEYPELFAQVHDLGVTAGAARELDRVKFHLNLGTKVGATDLAIKSCLEGTAKDCGETVANYMAAGVNKSDLDARKQDEDDLQGNNPAGSLTEEQTKAKAVNAIFAEAFELSGIEAGE